MRHDSLNAYKAKLLNEQQQQQQHSTLRNYASDHDYRQQCLRSIQICAQHMVVVRFFLQSLCDDLCCDVSFALQKNDTSSALSCAFAYNFGCSLQLCVDLTATMIVSLYQSSPSWQNLPYDDDDGTMKQTCAQWSIRSHRKIVLWQLLRCVCENSSYWLDNICHKFAII